jgi:hypothetical protein
MPFEMLLRHFRWKRYLWQISDRISTNKGWFFITISCLMEFWEFSIVDDFMVDWIFDKNRLVFFMDMREFSFEKAPIFHWSLLKNFMAREHLMFFFKVWLDDTPKDYTERKIFPNRSFVRKIKSNFLFFPERTIKNVLKSKISDF